MRKAVVVLALTLFMGGLAMAQKPPILPEPSAVPPAAQPGQTPPPPPPAQAPGIPPPPMQTPPPPAPPLEVVATAEKAVETVKEAKPFFTAGKIWQTINPKGGIELKGAVVYEGRIVAVLKFDPVTGTVLPEGFTTPARNISVPPELLRKEHERVIREIVVLDGAEYREPERCWVVPLSFKGKIVGRVKISDDGRFIIPDYPAEHEAGIR
ncbi:hypothetical protein [Desulfurobacterium sp.]